MTAMIIATSSSDEWKRNRVIKYAMLLFNIGHFKKKKTKAEFFNELSITM